MGELDETPITRSPSRAGRIWLLAFAMMLIGTTVAVWVEHVSEQSPQLATADSTPLPLPATEHFLEHPDPPADALTTIVDSAPVMPLPVEPPPEELSSDVAATEPQLKVDEQPPITIKPGSTWRNDLLTAIVLENWPVAAALARERRLWKSPDQSSSESALARESLAQWTLAVAADQQPGFAASETPLPVAWRHPLIPQFNKEGYHLHAELNAVLQGKAYDDACRLLTASAETTESGLLLDLADRQLFVSWPTAILAAMRASPEFAAAMIQHANVAGMVRVQQAISERDAAALRAATVQFFGTSAAAEAHRWLGDRDLSSGKFADAELQFCSALDSASTEQSAELERRRQLAAAYNGRQSTNDSTGAVATDSEFTSLLEEIERRPDVIAQRAQNSATITTTVMPVANYRLETKARFEGRSSPHANHAEPHDGDPFNKQLTVAADDQQIYVSNQFAVTAYDRRTMQPKWSHGVGSETGGIYEFPFQPMQPVIAGDVLLVRQLTSAGLELCCYQRRDGKLVWKQRPMTHVLTDPLVRQGEVCALIGGRVEEGQLQVEFARWDLMTGQWLGSSPVVKFRDVWNQCVPCTWTPGPRWIACQVGCISVCLTYQGEVRWLRRPTWLPRPVDDLQADFHSTPPILANDRAFLTILGTRAAECVDLATGKLLWRTPVPDLRGARGLAGSRLVLDIGDGLIGLDTDSGQIVWQQPLAGPLEACALDEQTILCAQCEKSLTSPQRLFLIWLDAATGQELAQSPLEIVARDDWRLGPLFTLDGTWWAFGGDGGNDRHCDLLQFSPINASTSFQSRE